MTLPLRVGVVGLGIGEQHARRAKQSPHVQLTALCDHTLTKAQSLADELDVPFVTEHADAVLTHPDLDLVVIASFDDDHYEHTKLALQHGKHVFVEKPIALTTAQLRDLKHELDQHGGRVKLATNVILRTAPLYRWLKATVEQGTFGEIYSIDGEYLYGRVHKITTGWRSQAPDYSVTLGGGVHMMDLMLWILGERPQHVFALGNRIVTRDTPFRYADFTSGVMQTPSGCVMRLNANFGCVHRHHHVLRIFGSRATFIYDDQGARLHLTRDEAVHASSIDLNPLPIHKADLFSSFVSAIVAGDSWDSQIFLDGVSLCIAVDESIKLAKQVEVVYL